MSFLKKMWVAFAILGCVSLPAQADDCYLPPTPNKTVDFKNTNDNAIAETADTLRTFDADLKTYLKCLDYEHDHGQMQDTDYKAKLSLYNQRVDWLQHTASEFNKQVKVFKAKSG